MTSMLGERNNKRIYKLQVGTHIHVCIYAILSHIQCIYTETFIFLSGYELIPNGLFYKFFSIGNRYRATFGKLYQISDRI